MRQDIPYLTPQTKSLAAEKIPVVLFGATLKRDGEKVGVVSYTGLVLLSIGNLIGKAEAAVAVNFAPLFYGDDFAYSGTLMMPLAFTLLSIGFANVIRTQWVLPQGRDTIFVHSVLTGAVINLIANFVLIPPFGAMGAAAATVLAEFSVPAVQFVYLRKELPYAQYLKTTGVYCLFGLVMAGVVALLGHVLPLHGWGKLAVQVIGGAAVYGALCLTYWKLAKRSDIFRLMRRK